MIRREALVPVDNFTIMPNDWLRDESLSFKARGVLAYLISHRIGWEISVRQLVDLGREGREAITGAVQELEEAGYLVREVTRAQGGRISGVDYVVTAPGQAAVATEVVGKPVPGKPSNGKPSDGKPSTGNQRTKKNISKKNISKKTSKTPPTPDDAVMPPGAPAAPAEYEPEIAAVLADGDHLLAHGTDLALLPGLPPPPVRQAPTAGEPEGFADWWAAYPRKTGKGSARTAYAKALRKTTPGVLLDALTAITPSWLAGEPRFVPHASTWLNGERWDDEVHPGAHMNPTDAAHLRNAQQVRDWQERERYDEQHYDAGPRAIGADSDLWAGAR